MKIGPGARSRYGVPRPLRRLNMHATPEKYSDRVAAQKRKGPKTNTALRLYILRRAGGRSQTSRHGHIGSTGEHGLHHLIWEVVDNAVIEAMADYLPQ